MQEGTYDVMQVCISGHCINSSYREFLAHNKAFCPDCGEPTITACPSCQALIKGYYNGGIISVVEVPVPSFCDTCGKPYPWQTSRVIAALDVLRLQGVAEADVQEVEQHLPDITRNTPRSHAAALTVRRVLGKARKPVYDLSMKVIGDIAAATAKSYLGL